MNPADTLPARLARWARVRPDTTAYTALEFRGHERLSHTLDYARLHGAAEATARRLRNHSDPGDRVAILCEHGLDYVVAFLGCLYSGRVAVPLLPITGARNTERVDRVLADARPSIALVSPGDTVTKAAVESAVRQVLSPESRASYGGAGAVGPAGDGSAGEGRTARKTDVAYLQYTSGSTKAPAGVRITHANLTAALGQLREAVPVAVERPIVTWLPFFHDMGLVIGLALPLYCGVPGVTMAPLDFAKRPIRWLRACSEHRAGLTGSPNFGLALAVSATTDAERSGLDLSALDVVLNGAEPVRAEALTEFTRVYAPHGFRHRAHTPGYGLAEATLSVTIAAPSTEPVAHHFDRAALGRGVAVPVADHPDNGSSADGFGGDSGGGGAAGSLLLVGCGAPVGQRVAVIDARSRAVPDGRVGEIWVSGPNVGGGYHLDPVASAATFGAERADEATGGWLRTGDLGFLFDGQLYIAGRAKDLIVVDGRNHYPSDIESTATAATPHLRAGHLTAFGHDDGAREDLVIVAEVVADLPAEVDPVDLARRVRSAVAAAHEVMPAAVVLVAPGRIPRTSSGKVRRGDCHTLFADGLLPVLAAVGTVPNGGAGRANPAGDRRRRGVPPRQP